MPDSTPKTTERNSLFELPVDWFACPAIRKIQEIGGAEEVVAYLAARGVLSKCTAPLERAAFEEFLEVVCGLDPRDIEQTVESWLDEGLLAEKEGSILIGGAL